MSLYTTYVRTINQRFLKRVIRKLGKIVFRKDFISDHFDNKILIKKYVQGKTFADIGALWGIHGENLFFALDNGARKVLAVDIYDETEKFKEEKLRRGQDIGFVQGDINAEDTIEKIGQQDVVLFSGVLYHAPDPVHMLMNMRRITKEILILNSAAIPEVRGMKNVAVFYPHLSQSQRKMWTRGIGSQRAITSPYEPSEGYGNWLWGITPSAMESMLNVAGFEVIEKYIYNFRVVFVCKTKSDILELTSGPWTERKHQESKGFSW